MWQINVNDPNYRVHIHVYLLKSHSKTCNNVECNGVFVLLYAWVQVDASQDVSLKNLLERLDALEYWKRETENEVATLRELVTKQGIVIRNLERELAVQNNITHALKSHVMDEKQKAVEDPEEKVETERKEHKNRIRNTKTCVTMNSEVETREIAGGVSFTAYLDHDINPGSKQTIKFNQVITNDGNAYNIHTGVFTCPEQGVYMFSFYIGERGSHDGSTQACAELVVNNQLAVGACVETMHTYQDLQGGNTAIVRLNQGDAVCVESISTGYHVEGGQSLRLTTFSGVYLYA